MISKDKIFDISYFSTHQQEIPFDPFTLVLQEENRN